MDFNNKRVMVLGTGISGISAVKLLCKVGADVVLYDSNESIQIEKVKQQLDMYQDTPIITGNLDHGLILTLDLVVISPGIPIEAPFVQQIKSAGISIWGEVELAYKLSRGRLVAITGTNGKTTTTALVGSIMKDYFESAYVVGNIGIPYTSIALDSKDHSVTVAEVSSFQLETTIQFRPNISAILNISPDHLDRHKTMERYASIKMSITKNQKDKDVCILNYEDPLLREFGKTLIIPVIYFSSSRKLSSGIYLDGETIIFQTPSKKIEICNVNELKLLGTHNYENVMAAVVIGLYSGVPIDSIRKTIKEFKAVEHRIEYVAEKNQVIYYNDSKGTNTDASIKAIKAMVRPTVLIAGGYDKDSDFDDWVKAFDHKIKTLVLLGATKEKIAQTAQKYGFSDIMFAENLEEAVKIASYVANVGEAVLLSPACASWDMFKSYEERGRLFKDYVNNL